MTEKRRPLEKRLKKLVFSWRLDSRKLVSNSRHNTPAAIYVELDALVSGWDFIDDTVQEYEIAIELNPSLEERYPKDRVYDAAVACCEDLSKRWDVLYEIAKKERLFVLKQIIEIERYNQQEIDRQKQKV